MNLQCIQINDASVHSRGGQSAAHGPHAALQKFSEALCQILDAQLSYLCKKNTQN